MARSVPWTRTLSLSGLGSYPDPDTNFQSEADVTREVTRWKEILGTVQEPISKVSLKGLSEM